MSLMRRCAISRTGNQLLLDLSRFIGDLDFPAGLTTTGAGSTTTLVDTALGRFGDDYILDWYVRITEDVNGNQYANQRVSNFVSSTTTATHGAFAGATGSGTTYELHRYSPDEKFSALDEARLTIFPALGTLVYDDSITADGDTHTFDIPTTVRRGPIDVWVEKPVSVDVDWNYDGDPHGDTTTKWTASSATLSTVSPSNDDRLVPKYQDSDATLITTAASTAATVTQVVAKMANGITAARAADRKMTAARWFYCTEADKVRLQILEDSDTVVASGAYHGGKGWELLTVEGTVIGSNATTLSVRIDIASTANASVIAYQRGWFYFGSAERVMESWAPVSRGSVRRDDTTQQFTLPYKPARGLQVRLIGRDILSALGTAAATQATNTMEVDEAESELLCAEAAKVLYRRGILSGSSLNAIGPRLSLAEQEIAKLKQVWTQQSPGPRLRSAWV